MAQRIDVRTKVQRQDHRVLGEQALDEPLDLLFDAAEYAHQDRGSPLCGVYLPTVSTGTSRPSSPRPATSGAAGSSSVSSA